MNSVTTVLLSFPPILALYLRFAESYGTAAGSAFLAGGVTLAFFVMGLFLSADITLSLNSRAGSRVRLLRNVLMGAVIVVSLTPLTLLIPSAPPILGEIVDVLPNGLAAQVSFTLVSGLGWTFANLLELLGLAAWFVCLLGIGIRLSRGQFYEALRLGDEDGGMGDPLQEQSPTSPKLETAGRSVWGVVRAKERLMMSRTKEMRSMLINTFFLAGFMVIYSLSGVFQSSPTSFLFILFIIGSLRLGERGQVAREGEALDNQDLVPGTYQICQRGLSGTGDTAAVVADACRRGCRRPPDTGGLAAAHLSAAYRSLAPGGARGRGDNDGGRDVLRREVRAEHI